jgi:hypothetical protein
VKSFWVVKESRAWPTSFNFLAIPVCQNRLLILEGVGSPSQFVFPRSFIDITHRDRCTE